jgi:hypothetical protein
VLSLAPGSCFIPASTAVLIAKLGVLLPETSRYLICIGDDALQSLSTSGMHAIRCSGVLCEKEAAGEAVADSKASDTHHCSKGIGRSIQLFCLSMFIGGLACIFEADTRHRHHGR